jgi:hypothetical protein
VGRKDAFQGGRYDQGRRKETSWKLPALQAAKKEIEGICLGQLWPQEKN